MDAAFAIEPNWVGGVTLRRAWQTGILRGVSGKEQRSALLTWPRRKLNFTVDLFSISDIATLRRYLFKYQHGIWGCPIYPDQSVLTAQASAGQPVVYCDATNRDFQHGDYAILMAPTGKGIAAVEIAVVNVVLDTWLGMVSNLSGTWPVGTLVFPVFEARLDTNLETIITTPSMTSLDVEAVEAFE